MRLQLPFRILPIDSYYLVCQTDEDPKYVTSYNLKIYLFSDQNPINEILISFGSFFSLIGLLMTDHPV